MHFFTKNGNIFWTFEIVVLCIKPSTDDRGCNVLSNLFCKDKQTVKTEPSSWRGLWWREQLSHQQDAKFQKNFSTVQKLSGFGYSSKGKKRQSALGIMYLINHSAWLSKRKICKDRKHTGEATMVLNMCQGDEEDPSRPSITSHIWAGEQQQEEVQMFRASFPQRHSHFPLSL